jgi:hypothetical protein
MLERKRATPGLMLGGYIELENVKQRIRDIDASTGKAVTNFLRPPETLERA